MKISCILKYIQSLYLAMNNHTSQYNLCLKHNNQPNSFSVSSFARESDLGTLKYLLFFANSLFNKDVPKHLLN